MSRMRSCSHTTGSQHSPAKAYRASDQASQGVLSGTLQGRAMANPVAGWTAPWGGEPPVSTHDQLRHHGLRLHIAAAVGEEHIKRGAQPGAHHEHAGDDVAT
jgi:hypothetical protein